MRAVDKVPGFESQGPYLLQPPAGRPTTAPEAVDFLLHNAIKRGASDLHIAHQAHAHVEALHLVRLRIHGKLVGLKVDFLSPIYREVIARIKVLAGLDTTETNSPQDGQIEMQTPEGETFVIRLNTVPALNGEELVARIQRSSEKVLTLDQLAMTKEMHQRMQSLIQQKSGLIVLNGPAGSGKTTTIYALLQTLACPERKIITAEDPVELQLRYVSHTQISSKVDYTHLSRAFMRQDADIIFIGEIRDAASALATVQLAQTGHLVVSTIHTRDAVGVISRLGAMDIHPNFIATTLIGSLSQRLVPRLCDHCKVEAQLTDAVMDRIEAICTCPDGAKIYKTGPGCPKCVGGTVGRMPIFELFVADGELCEMINREDSLNEIQKLALSKGMRSLAQEALFRVYGGYVDFEHVRSFVFSVGY